MGNQYFLVNLWRILIFYYPCNHKQMNMLFTRLDSIWFLIFSYVMDGNFRSNGKELLQART